MKTLAETRAEQDRQLIHANLPVLAAYAWFNYRQRGRGAVVIDTNQVSADAANMNALVLSIPLGYVTPEMAHQKHTPLPSDMYAMIREYLPESEIVVSIVREIQERDYMGHYRMTITPTPPEIYKTIGAQMLAQTN